MSLISSIQSLKYRQIKELDKVVENALNMKKEEFLVKLRDKFKSYNLELVDSIRYLLIGYSANETARSLLRGLLWVDFFHFN